MNPLKLKATSMVPAKLILADWEASYWQTYTGHPNGVLTNSGEPLFCLYLLYV